MCANFLVKATDILRPRIVETVEWKIRGWEGLMIPKRSFLPGMIISPYKAKITCIFKKVTIDSEESKVFIEQDRLRIHWGKCNQR